MTLQLNISLYILGIIILTVMCLLKVIWSFALLNFGIYLFRYLTYFNLINHIKEGLIGFNRRYLVPILALIWGCIFIKLSLVTFHYHLK